MNKLLKMLGYSNKEIEIIFVLYNNPGMTFKEIETKTGFRQPEVSYSIKTLKTEGFIEKSNGGNLKGKNGRPLVYLSLSYAVFPTLVYKSNLFIEQIKHDYEKLKTYVK